MVPSPPDLHAAYVAHEQPVEHLTVELVDRPGVAVDQPARDGGLGPIGPGRGDLARRRWPAAPPPR